MCTCRTGTVRDVTHSGPRTFDIYVWVLAGALGRSDRMPASDSCQTNHSFLRSSASNWSLWSAPQGCKKHQHKRTNRQTTTHTLTTRQKLLGIHGCFFTLLVTSFPSVPLCVSHFPQVHDVSRTHVFDFMRTALSDVTHPCIWHGSKAQETCHFTSTCRSYA